MLQNAIRVKLSEVGLVLRNNVGTYLTRYGAPIAIGVPGLSDLTLFANGGTTVFIDIYCCSGGVSNQNYQFLAFVVILGYEYIILRSVKEAENLCSRLMKLKS